MPGHVSNTDVEAAEKAFELLFVLVQPTRQKIIQALRDSNRPLYIKEIAELIGASQRNTALHLATLAEFGLVDGEYREIQKATPLKLGRAAKFYHLTPKVNETITQLAQLIERMRPILPPPRHVSTRAR